MVKGVQILLVNLSPNLVSRVSTGTPVLISMMLALLSTATAQTPDIINIDLTKDASAYNPSAHQLPGVIGKSSGVTLNAMGTGEIVTESVEQSLALDDAGDLFLSLDNLDTSVTSFVSESSDLTNGSWTPRFALRGKSATDLLIPRDRPKQFYRTEEAPDPAPVVRPNIVLLMAEDCSTHWFDLYNPTYGTSTPHVESLAEQGLVFDNAFCGVAVCSPARSALIAGRHPTSTGVSWHRNNEKVDLSNGLLAFPQYLRKAGYYTTNSTKQDYNLNVSNAWNNASSDEFGWRNRPTPETPFFHVRTLFESHESRIRNVTASTRVNHDPDAVNLYPIHPDTTLFRKTYAKYLDQIRVIDNDVGRMVSALKADGLFEDTIIIFISDNGGTVAGSKGYIHNTGLEIPLVVHIPEKWRHLAPTAPDGRVSGFVSLVDMGASILSLAGLGVPNKMEGVPFLGEHVTLEMVNSNDEALSASDRFDEVYNVIRSLQKGNLKYIRNYNPFYPYALYSRYRYGMNAQAQWKDLYDAGQLNPDQSKFYEPRQAEELYDIAADPFELNNLANDPAYADSLVALRTNLYDRMTGMPDVAIITEYVFLSENGEEDPIQYGEDNKERIKRYVDIADLMLDSYANVAAELQTHLASADPLDRYWALTTCAAFGSEAAALKPTVDSLISSETSGLVLSRAAVFLGELGEPLSVVQNAVNKALEKSNNQVECEQVLNDVVHLQDTLGYDFEPQPVRFGGQDRRTDYLGW